MTSRAMPCALVWALALAGGCGGRSTPVDDGGPDGDGDADGDGGYAPFEEADVPGELTGDYAAVRIWALAADDVLVCTNDPVDERGGIGRFDGTRVVVEHADAPCVDVWGLAAAEAWAIVEDPETLDQRVLRREGSSWREEPLDPAGSCSFEAFVATSEGQPLLLGLCREGGETVRWLFAHTGDRWAMSERWCPPLSMMSEVRGAVALEWDVAFYGRRVAPAEAIVVPSMSALLGYPAEVAIWAGGDDLSGLMATDGDALYARGATGEWAAHPCPPPAPGSGACWSSATRSPGGALFLGGGHGSSGDSGDDDWRLHRWDGAAFSQILEPCGGPSPHCSVFDVSATEDRLFAALGRDWTTTLVWTDISD